MSMPDQFLETLTVKKVLRESQNSILFKRTFFFMIPDSAFNSVRVV